MLMFTSPGDDYDSPDKVKEYTIKYSKFASNLTEVKPSDKNRAGSLNRDATADAENHLTL